MRLINADTLEFVEFAQLFCNEPPYYILSHRWQEDEISYKDFKKGRRKDSKGYQKVLDFCKFARKRHEKYREKDTHFLDYPCYIWIDTCCIDKSSSAELSLSINSMWRWYRCATECHIYLSDVHTSEQGPELDKELRVSTWFRRGWTLQELLAPADNGARLLLNSRWELIGQVPSYSFRRKFQSTIHYLHNKDAESLLSVVSEITGIQENYLSGRRSIASASVACRMSWASRRNTTLMEDEAYCLMGIFDVNMPLLYGEGGKAFRRLQEEIIKNSTDHSIFTSTFSSNGLSPMLAESSAEFSKYHDVFIDSESDDGAARLSAIQPFEITNLGIRFRAAIRRGVSRSDEVLWAFQLNCFGTASSEDGCVPIHIVSYEVMKQDESMEQPSVLRKTAVSRGEKDLHWYFKSLEGPVRKTFYVKVWRD